MNYLADTNILLRLVELQSAHHTEAKNAVDKLLKRGDTLYLLLQNVSEFWNVCTRPFDKNGLGFSIAETDAELSKIEQVFDILPDTLETYENWRELVVKHSVLGVKVHDVKIVAAMKTHNIPKLLTFNAKDFKRFTEIEAVEPKDVQSFFENSIKSHKLPYKSLKTATVPYSSTFGGRANSISFATKSL